MATASIPSASADFRPLLAFVRQHRMAILEEHGALGFCLQLVDGGPSSRLAADAAELVAGLEPDVQDYAISSAYARLIGDEARKALSAYFTPPALAGATLKAIVELVDDPGQNLRIIDPACGGGSFLVPTARMLIQRHVDLGRDVASACAQVLSGMRGIEIDSGLARISAALLKRMVRREWGVEVEASKVVMCANALTTELSEGFDIAIGNPPYSKVWRSGAEEARLLAGRADLGGHTNLYALFVIRALDWLKPGGGLAFVLPTSFVAGPYFAGLREEILDRAAVIRIDLHQQREDLFLDATQDVCLLVLRRHSGAVSATPYTLGLIDNAGKRVVLGTADTPAGGEPWSLPVPSKGLAGGHHQLVGRSKAATLSAYGYQMRVGKVVPTREGDRLYKEAGSKCLPVLWASDVRPDGSFQFQGSARTANSAWYAPVAFEEVRYASFGRSVLVQRTSNRDQQRRLNAAVVSAAFAAEHADHGYVAENHVIVIEPIPGKVTVEPDIVAAILNSAIVNQRFSAVSGSFSVSARLLARLALPAAADLPTTVSKVEPALADLFKELDGILVPIPPKGQPELG
jgi:adenine-specific DNA-methyltransferase